MRGDSIRDLYAKTLALVGLGVLAGTGALVDYWPSGVRLPAVDSGLIQPELNLAMALPSDAFDREPPVVRAALPERRRAAVPPTRVVAAALPEIPSSDIVEAFGGDGVVLAVAALRPPALVPVAFAEGTSRAPLGEEVTLTRPVYEWPESPVMMSAAPVTLAAVDAPGVLAGVVRVTKSSLVLTGRKTGASIVGAFRAVSGAVRKALPN